MNVKDVATQLAPFYKAHGFQRKGSTFYKIQNEIACSIYFERPGGLYAGYSIWPLYIPTSVRYLTYGKRMDNVKGSNVDALFYLSEMTDCSEWIESVKRFSESFVFPHFEEVDSPQKLLEFLNKGHENSCKFWRANKCYFYKMRAYTNFILANYPQMKVDIELSNYWKYNYPAYDEWREELAKELSILEKMAIAPIEERQKFIEETTNYTADKCFKNIKRQVSSNN